MANDLATQLAQTQENFNKVTSELETKLNTTTNAAGGTGTASGTGGNVHIGSDLVSYTTLIKYNLIVESKGL